MTGRLRDKNSTRPRILADLIVIGGAAAAVALFSISIDGFERLNEFSRNHEGYEIDELLTVGFFASIALILFSWRRVTDQRREIAARRAVDGQRDQRGRAVR